MYVCQVGYVGFLGLWIFVTFAVFKHGLTMTGVVSAILCALLLRFFLKRQSRIRFGAANLKVKQTEPTSEGGVAFI